MVDAAPAHSRVVLHRLVGPRTDELPPIVARVSGDEAAVRRVSRGLPEGPATPEAVAARIRGAGGLFEWGEPEPIAGVAALLRHCRDRGASSIEILRADPGLLTDLQLGSFFAASISGRIARRALHALPLLPLLRGMVALPSLALAADVSFWSGVRAAATRREWKRLTRSSYVVLFYHRIAGDGKPGQERIDMRPEVFERQMRWLRRLGFRPLTTEQLVAFHNDPEATLPPRAFFLAADDGFRDATLALGRHVDLRPCLFVTTSAVGGHASWAWAGGEAIASWPELREIASRGGAIASHARTHVSLTELDPVALASELRKSLSELRAQVPDAVAMLAYPYGRHSGVVRAAAAAAGYDVAFTTEPGRNGAGTDPYGLHRVGLKDWDGPTAVTWKALTGRLVPRPFERWKLRARGLQADGGRGPERRSR